MAITEGKTNFFNFIGPSAFIAGILLCIVSVFVNHPYLTIGILFFGIVVGLLNITAEEVVKLLVSTTGIIIGSQFLKSALSNSIIPSFIIEPVLMLLQSLILFFAPAIIIVGIKTIFDIASD
jgi:hypothetical protein